MKKYLENTIKYYNDNAEEYAENTLSCDMNEIYDPFLALLPKEKKILDLGCGVGRDSKAFTSLGYYVTSVDGSAKIAAKAEKNIRGPVRCISFFELDYEEEFDAIWACASLLHVSKSDMPLAMDRIKTALKDNGILFTCFKYGDNEYIKDGRSFNNYDEVSINEAINSESGFKIIDVFITLDVRKDRPDEKWLNVLAVKID